MYKLAEHKFLETNKQNVNWYCRLCANAREEQAQQEQGNGEILQKINNLEQTVRDLVSQVNKLNTSINFNYSKHNLNEKSTSTQEENDTERHVPEQASSFHLQKPNTNTNVIQTRSKSVDGAVLEAQGQALTNTHTKKEKPKEKAEVKLAVQKEEKDE